MKGQDLPYPLNRERMMTTRKTRENTHLHEDQLYRNQKRPINPEDRRASQEREERRGRA